MGNFVRLLIAECVKLKCSSAWRMVWLFPLVYLVVDFWVFNRPIYRMHNLPPELANTYELMPLKVGGALWGGFFHPLMLAMLPALLFWPEHKGKLWRHLQTMPVSRRLFYSTKLFMTLGLSAVILGIIWLGLRLEHGMAACLNPAFALPFHGCELAKMLGWLWLGSLPILALYLWVSDRINSLAVPVVFGLIGLMLTIALSGQEVVPSWRRDLIPWVLPYFCAQQAIPNKNARQEGHIAGSPYRIEPNVTRLPSGRKIKTWQNIPDEVLFPPPPPTPSRILAYFSLGTFVFLVGLGLVDAGRQRF